MNKSSKEIQEEYVMYILVNSDLNMQKGKIAAQCCHSACNVIRIIEKWNKHPMWYKRWLEHHEPKIVLKAPEVVLRTIIEKLSYSSTNPDSIWCIHTVDIGRTQIPANSLTTIAFRPMMRQSTPQILKDLKLM